MDNIRYIDVIFGLLLLYIIMNIHAKKEGFSDSISDADRETLRNISSLYNQKSLTVSNLTVTDNVNISGDTNIDGKLTVKKNSQLKDLVVDGKLTVKNGSEFSGDRHYFQDEENAGKLRVGAAWGKPGIYAEDKKELAIGSSKKINILGSPIYADNSFYSQKHIRANNNIYLGGGEKPYMKASGPNLEIYADRVKIPGHVEINGATWMKNPIHSGVNKSLRY